MRSSVAPPAVVKKKGELREKLAPGRRELGRIRWF